MACASKSRCAAVFGLLLVLAAAAAAPASSTRQLLAEHDSGTAPFPNCAWWQEFSVATGNQAFPDTNAAYWIMPYSVGKDTELVIKGEFIEARYFSIQLYNASLGDFIFEACQFNVTPGVTDYQMYAEPGGLNPFRATNAGVCSAAQEAGDTSGTFSIRLTNNLPVPRADTLPAGRNVQDREQGMYYIVLRVYLPAEQKTSAIPLPTVDLIEGGKTFTLPQCQPGEKQLPIPQSSSNSSDSETAQEVPPSVWLRQPVGGVFPNKETGYLAAYLPPEYLNDKLFVISLLPPKSPTGDQPVVWPNAAYQARYWSICNNINEQPQPVIINTVNGTTQTGCLADTQVAPDEGGYGTVTIVVSAPDSRPATAVNWLPTSLDYPDAMEVLLYRNMLCSQDFKQCVTNVPDNNSPEDAEAVLGPHYPRSTWCNPEVFAQGATAAEGAKLCFEAAGGSSA